MKSIRLLELNNVTLVGRLTKDPELRYTSKGYPVCNFDIAINRRYKTASGKWQDDVSFVPVVVWGPAAERCNERAKKGSPIHLTGRLKSRTWKTKEGQSRSTLEVLASRVQFLTRGKVAADGTSKLEHEEHAEHVEHVEHVEHAEHVEHVEHAEHEE